MTSRNMITVHENFSKNIFKCGLMPTKKVFLLFLVKVFFSNTSFKLLTKASLTNADFSNSKFKSSMNQIIWN